MNSSTGNWQINGTGYLQDGTRVSLNDNFYITALTDMIFGTPSEDLTLTQLIAPHTSRAMVLATEVNYKYFFSRMNMFSTIEVVKGYSTNDANVNARIQYEQASQEYSSLYDEWQSAVLNFGEESETAKEAYRKVQKSLEDIRISQQRMEDTDMPDNTVYILLIPDISKRISPDVNYFTCDESLFTLSADEQYNILQTVENSGQKIITMENRLIQPKLPRFAINANVKIWEGYSL